MLINILDMFTNYFHSIRRRAINNITPGTPIKPTTRAVMGLIPILNSQNAPTRLITNRIPAPIMAFTISLNTTFRGTTRSLPNKTTMETPRYRLWLRKGSFGSPHLGSSLYIIVSAPLLW